MLALMDFSVTEYQCGPFCLVKTVQKLLDRPKAEYWTAQVWEVVETHIVSWGCQVWAFCSTLTQVWMAAGE